jgi:LysM repeat protein
MADRWGEEDSVLSTQYSALNRSGRRTKLRGRRSGFGKRRGLPVALPGALVLVLALVLGAIYWNGSQARPESAPQPAVAGAAASATPESMPTVQPTAIVVVEAAPTPAPSDVLATATPPAEKHYLQGGGEVPPPPAPTDPPTTPSPSPTPQPTPDETEYYVVESGDNLWDLATAAGVSVGFLLELNNLSDPSSLSVGQRLVVPKGSIGKRDDVSSRGGARPAFVWPAYGRITTYFWESGSAWIGGHHTGLDIASTYGDPVVAAAAGTVEVAQYGYNRGLGNIIMISNGDGYETLYGHLQTIHVEVGQRVAQGQYIGEVGSTGYSTGPHVHFEVRLRGEYQNPLSFLP